MRLVADAIRSAAMVLIVLTPRYAGSILCRNELKLARQSGARCVALAPSPLDDTARQLAQEFELSEPIAFEDPQFATRIATMLTRAGEIAVEVAAPKPPSQKISSSDRFFINFSSADSAHVTFLRQALERSKIPMWDFLEGSRDFQKPLAHEIEQAIATSAGVLSVVTNSWRDSQWVLREYLFAREIDKPTFLLLFEPIRPTLIISERTLIDFTADREKGMQQLTREIAEMIA